MARLSAMERSGPENTWRETNFCASGLIVAGKGTTRVMCAVPSASSVQVSDCGTIVGWFCCAGIAGNSMNTANVIGAKIVVVSRCLITRIFFSSGWI